MATERPYEVLHLEDLAALESVCNQVAANGGTVVSVFATGKCDPDGIGNFAVLIRGESQPIEKAMAVMAACFEPCAACGGDGKEKRGYGGVLCATCHGTGRTPTPCGRAFIELFGPHFAAMQRGK